jgi:hypothetical protein
MPAMQTSELFYRLAPAIPLILKSRKSFAKSLRASGSLPDENEKGSRIWQLKSLRELEIVEADPTA